MPRLRIGELLIKQGLITENQLQEVINLQKQHKGRIGELLIKQGAIKEEDLATTLGAQLMIPYASYASGLLKPKADQDLQTLIPYDFAKKNLVLPLTRNMDSLTCAVFDPLDFIIIDNLKILTGCDLNLVIATKTDLSRAINEFYVISKGGDSKTSMLDRAVEKTYVSLDDIRAPAAGEVSMDAELSIDRLIAKAGEAPVVKLVDLLIRQAIDEKASDIHIGPFKDKLEIR